MRLDVTIVKLWFSGCDRWKRLQLCCCELTLRLLQEKGALEVKSPTNFLWPITISRHHTPQAILLGLEGSDPETISTGSIPSRYDFIVNNKTLVLGGTHRIEYDMDRDMLWRYVSTIQMLHGQDFITGWSWDQVLPTQWVLLLWHSASIRMFALALTEWGSPALGLKESFWLQTNISGKCPTVERTRLSWCF